jgi:hypothetical protein
MLCFVVQVAVVSNYWKKRSNDASIGLEVGPPSLDEIDDAIDAAAFYLRSQLQADGRFTYRVSTDDGVFVTPRYNILRHAGAIFALGTYHEAFSSQEVEMAILRAGDYLRTAVAPVPGHDELLAVWSKQEIENASAPDQAKLGGTGLGLVALLTVEQCRPGTTDIETLRKLGNFLLYMQKEDGSFYSKFVPGESELDDWVSLYYPGEAALGLTMLYETDPDNKWLGGARKALEHLAQSRRGQEIVPADHWALLATERLFQFLDPRSDGPLCERLNDHAAQVCQSIVQSQVTDRLDRLRVGSFDEEGRTAPCATRMEGLLAALSHLPSRHSALRRQIKQSCDLGIGFLLRAQVRQAHHTGGFPRSILGHPDYASYVVGESNPRWTEIRIDYVQHALSALLQYREHLAGQTVGEMPTLSQR